jgi:dehydrogenase/reductase SDR family member 1
VSLMPRTVLVTGASRGVGKGIAVSLPKEGSRVFGTGRTIGNTDLPGDIVRLPCDHTRDDETAAVFARIPAESDGLDLLVNSAWGGYERMTENGTFTWALPFWEQPAHRWSSMMDAGVRAVFVNSSFAAKMMVPRHRGLIMNITYWAARKHRKCHLRDRKGGN